MSEKAIAPCLQELYDSNKKWLALPYSERSHFTKAMEGLLRSECVHLIEELSAAEDQNKDYGEIFDQYETTVTELKAQLSAAQQQVATLQAEILSLEESLEAQEQKYKDCPHPKGPEYWPCACSYDRKSDVCAVHAPQLTALKAELAEMTRSRDSWQKAQQESFASAAANADICARLKAQLPQCK